MTAGLAVSALFVDGVKPASSCNPGVVCKGFSDLGVFSLSEQALSRSGRINKSDISFFIKKN